jgi:hypothetical protein
MHLGTDAEIRKTMEKLSDLAHTLSPSASLPLSLSLNLSPSLSLPLSLSLSLSPSLSLSLCLTQAHFKLLPRVANDSKWFYFSMDTNEAKVGQE